MLETDVLKNLRLEDRCCCDRKRKTSPPETNQSGLGMADHPHTVDRWDDVTGENLIEQIAAVGDYLVALETYRAAVKCPA